MGHRPGQPRLYGQPRPSTHRALVLLASASLVLTGAASNAVANTNPTPDGVVMSVTGMTDNGYVRGPGETRWTNRGGALQAAPAIAHVAGITHQIGVTESATLVHRTAQTDWHDLAPNNGPCTKPTAAVRGTTVVVSCIASDGAGRWFTFDGTQQQPTTPGMAALGGRVSALQVSTSEGDDSFLAVGGPYQVTNEDTGETFRGNTYFRAPADLNWFKLGYWCDGHAGSAMTKDTWFMACNSGSSIRVVTADTANDRYHDYTVPGRADGVVSIVPTGESQADLLVQGLDGFIRHRSISVTGPTDRSWTQLSGRAKGGVAAAAHAG